MGGFGGGGPDSDTINTAFADLLLPSAESDAMLKVMERQEQLLERMVTSNQAIAENSRNSGGLGP